MKALLRYQNSENLFWNVGWKEVNDRIQEYFICAMREISKASTNIERAVVELCNILKKARDGNKEVLFFGSRQDFHIISHANVDFLKMNHLRIVNMGIPEMTAFGNDFPYPYHFKEFLNRRGFGNGSVLVGIQLGEHSKLLEEGFKYNFANNGINVLITNKIGNYDTIHNVIDIGTEGGLISGDIAQLILHYASANIALETDTSFGDKAAARFNDYCDLLNESFESSLFTRDKLSEISLIIREKLLLGNSVFAFGNGGSAAIASYFSEGLRDVYSNLMKSYGKIFDVTSFVGNISYSIDQGYYNNDVFTRIIRDLGAGKGDVLFGVSTSGNSENIVHPFTNIQETVRIGILGFDDGGRIGRGDMKDIAFIVPDAGGFRSYQRAEDGQRIAISSILSTF